ncbi:STAS domain-containing protein [Micromonospora sp. WMMD882]|uniref:STAS domain-containing protein n=1 Tax=Micromonospora sp. WMMD882 TaxID=3015151 RepID=UPI00248C31FD|nr:STAS domain-containing protein [Micromonospora sp. WMMD882]WBB80746.1 STAS domain-containing protein [Micromonospora sp. WMMD882]
MTVVPEDRLMTLICDTCGEAATGRAYVLPDAEVVWTLVTDLGWSGSPFASGPHHCPHCSLLAPPTGGHASCDDHGPGGILGIDHVDDVTVVTPTGDIDLDTGDTLRAALSHAADMGGDVIVDLTRVHLVDSAGLGLLVRAHLDARDRGATLCLATPSPFVRTVLRTMRLDGVFTVVDDRETGLAHLAVTPAGPVGHAAVAGRRA